MKALFKTVANLVWPDPNEPEPVAVAFLADWLVRKREREAAIANRKRAFVAFMESWKHEIPTADGQAMNIERLKRDIVDELFANPGASLDDYLRRNSAYRDARAAVKGWFDTISRNFDHFKGLMERFRDEEPAQFDRSAKDFESRFRAFKQWAISKEPSLAGNRELDTAWARHLFSKIPDRLGTITIS